MKILPTLCSKVVLLLDVLFPCKDKQLIRNIMKTAFKICFKKYENIKDVKSLKNFYPTIKSFRDLYIKAVVLAFCIKEKNQLLECLNGLSAHLAVQHPDVTPLSVLTTHYCIPEDNDATSDLWHYTSF